MTSFAFQLYSLHAVDDPLPTVVERVGETGFDGVELAGLGDADPEDVGDALERTGLELAGAHVGIEELEANAEAVAETYGALGCENVVVPWFEPEEFEDRASVEAAGARLTPSPRTSRSTTSLCTTTTTTRSSRTSTANRL
ncbi:sugar phosphate isomerase/epimerase [Halogeometricum sp. CBA1124]|uniref:sugar phosphate isomerase/epimerase family protein n=1 Tax=Halogeometricum sp. CBA1124 TaxID=2668071 RepID=UPI001E2A9BDD|nr:hypothetical protein [Halogeometricum sp. CBA1124]